jgi:hypothetical protein
MGVGDGVYDGSRDGSGLCDRGSFQGFPAISLQISWSSASHHYVCGFPRLKIFVAGKIPCSFPWKWLNPERLLLSPSFCSACSSPDSGSPDRPSIAKLDFLAASGLEGYRNWLLPPFGGEHSEIRLIAAPGRTNNMCAVPDTQLRAERDWCDRGRHCRGGRSKQEDASTN